MKFELGNGLYLALARAKVAIPYNDSHNLRSCGTDQQRAVKWIAFLNETEKMVEYVDKSLKTDILADGVRVNASVFTHFRLPVWAGACAWTDVVNNRSLWGRVENLLEQ